MHIFSIPWHSHSGDLDLHSDLITSSHKYILGWHYLQLHLPYIILSKLLSDCHFFCSYSLSNSLDQSYITHLILLLSQSLIISTWINPVVEVFIVLVQFSCSVMSDSLWPDGLQHTRLPCPSPAPRVYSNLCPLSWWCHPTISSSVVPFSSCPQSFSATGSFLMSQFFTSGGQSIGVSASTLVLPMNTQDRSPLGWTGWISL